MTVGETAPVTEEIVSDEALPAAEATGAPAAAEEAEAKEAEAQTEEAAELAFFVDWTAEQLGGDPKEGVFFLKDMAEEGNVVGWRAGVTRQSVLGRLARWLTRKKGAVIKGVDMANRTPMARVTEMGVTGLSKATELVAGYGNQVSQLLEKVEGAKWEALKLTDAGWRERRRAKKFLRWMQRRLPDLARDQQMVERLQGMLPEDVELGEVLEVMLTELAAVQTAVQQVVDGTEAERAYTRDRETGVVLDADGVEVVPTFSAV